MATNFERLQAKLPGRNFREMTEEEIGWQSEKAQEFLQTDPEAVAVVWNAGVPTSCVGRVAQVIEFLNGGSKQLGGFFSYRSM